MNGHPLEKTARLRRPPAQRGQHADLRDLVRFDRRDVAEAGEQRRRQVGQLASEFVHRPLPVVGLPGHRAHHDGVQLGRDVIAKPEQRRRHGGRLLVENLHEVLPFVGRLAGEHLVDQAADGVDVGAGIGRAPRRLLGGHVLRRPHGHPRVGEPPPQIAVGVLLVLDVGVLAALGDPEVEHLDEVLLPVAGQDEDVLRLDVPVDDVDLVRRLDGARRSARRCAGRAPRPASPPGR